LFFACLFAAGTMKLNIKVLKAMSLLDVGRFLLDRINMGRKAKVRAVSPLKAKELVKAHLADLEQRLSQDFLFGQTHSCRFFHLS
jgi:hypothetical protein